MQPTSTITVRSARPADRDALVAWNQAMAMETEGRQLAAQTLSAGVQAVLDDPGKGFYLIAERDGQALGGLLITFEWSDWRNARMWWIQSVYVAQQARGQGVFRALFDAVREQAVAEGIAVLRLYVERDNRVARQVYEARGMHSSGYRMYELELA